MERAFLRRSPSPGKLTFQYKAEFDIYCCTQLMRAPGYSTIRTSSACHGLRSIRTALLNPRAAVRFLPTLDLNASTCSFDKLPCND